VRQYLLLVYTDQRCRRKPRRRRRVGYPVTWFEIYSEDPDALHDFYSSVFGWKFQPMGEDYAVIDTASDEGIGGGIGKAEGVNQTVFSIEVDDPRTILDSVEANGGKAVVPVTETPGVVTYAQFADPQGNVVGLFKWAS
jgi:uncharacterized protein